ncbi:hypothetical protein DFH08DRAFT_824742 [Mycena albidolilacea]|uniref:Uncharacterized protein n=1 Tax=Mycena albidolilacea TaxID=1033008 RepID=A0AAD6Z3W0_9AGAR|nr:hypothetical protein DFH08DRAFT_824742 [Mycena albidolilacea]
MSLWGGEWYQNEGIEGIIRRAEVAALEYVKLPIFASIDLAELFGRGIRSPGKKAGRTARSSLAKTFLLQQHAARLAPGSVLNDASWDHQAMNPIPTTLDPLPPPQSEPSIPPLRPTQCLLPDLIPALSAFPALLRPPGPTTNWFRSTHSRHFGVLRPLRGCTSAMPLGEAPLNASTYCTNSIPSPPNCIPPAWSPIPRSRCLSPSSVQCGLPFLSSRNNAAAVIFNRRQPQPHSAPTLTLTVTLPHS